MNRHKSLLNIWVNLKMSLWKITTAILSKNQNALLGTIINNTIQWRRKIWKINRQWNPTQSKLIKSRIENRWGRRAQTIMDKTNWCKMIMPKMCKTLIIKTKGINNLKEIPWLTTIGTLRFCKIWIKLPIQNSLWTFSTHSTSLISRISGEMQNYRYHFSNKLTRCHFWTKPVRYLTSSLIMSK